MEENIETKTNSSNNSMMIALVAIIAVVAIAGVLIVSAKKGESNKTTEDDNSKTDLVMPTKSDEPSDTMQEEGSETSSEAMKETETSPTPTPMVSTSVNPAGGTTTSSIKEITITASNFKYDLPSITVKKGDTVRLTVKNIEGTHDWKLDEFNAKTEMLQSGQDQTIEFVADKTGQFEYYCSVGKHRQMGMKGTFTVQ